MSRNSRVRDRGYVSSHVSIAAATYDEFTLDYLVVAGGGGWWWLANGGGGGAGGLRSTVTATLVAVELEWWQLFAETPLTIVTVVSYTVTVGAGGAENTGGGVGSTGGGSTFSSVTATGGTGASGTIGGSSNTFSAITADGYKRCWWFGC
jgi:hypothetical protein